MLHILLCLAIIFLFGGVPIMCQPENEARSPSTASALMIPDDELEQKIIEAVQGNGESASKLGVHFAVQLNDSSALYWDIIGAENGHLEAQYGLAMSLIDKGINQKIRGIFWLRILALKGHERAVKMLSKLGLSLDDIRPPDDNLFSYTDQFSETEIDRYKKGAFQGNGKAAFILATYYRETSMDEISAEYWFRIGAQNDDIECQYLYGQILSAKEDELEQERGRFWMHRATQNGYNP